MLTTKELKEYKDPLEYYLYKNLNKPLVNYGDLKKVQKPLLERLLKQKTDWYYKLTRAYKILK